MIFLKYLDNLEEVALIEEPDSTIKYANKAIFYLFWNKS